MIRFWHPFILIITGALIATISVPIALFVGGAAMGLGLGFSLGAWLGYKEGP